MNDSGWRYGDEIRRIHRTAVIADEAIIGERVEIGPHVVIDSGVTIADDVTIFAGAYIGKPPKVTGIVPHKEYIQRTYIGSGSVIGSLCTIYSGVSLSTDILIGDGVRIRENTAIGKESVIGSNSTIQNDVRIGDRVRVVDLSHITAGVTIENDVFWSVNVVSMNDNRDGKGLYRLTVGEGAFIGGGALLLPGSDVGARSVVAAGAVVTHPVRAGTRVQGVPARRVHDLSYDGQALHPVEE